MAYIGRDTDKISNVEVLDNITFDGSSSYTLQKGGSNFTPSSANTLLLSIDGVVQAGNFTVSGSTIDFGTAVAGTSTCDFILHYGVGLITSVSDGTVTTAKLADSSVSLAKLTATGTKSSSTFLRGDNTFAGAGITMADQWRITSTFTGDANPISNNWEQIDVASRLQGTLGSSMTQSSGIFTFPQTGIYLVTFNGNFSKNGDDRSIAVYVETTTDNSNYSATSYAVAFIQQTTSNWTGSSLNTSVLVDVQDTANDKIRFRVDSQNNAQVDGSTNETLTGATFIRLGDT